jgi:hypothetical protein
MWSARRYSLTEALRQRIEFVRAKVWHAQHPASKNRKPPFSNALFQPGDRVRVKADYVPGHVRMPG